MLLSGAGTASQAMGGKIPNAILVAGCPSRAARVSNYVDIFVPEKGDLGDMFADNVSLPIAQFYSDDSDAIKVGATNFTRVLASGRSKVSINLEQLKVTDVTRRKYLPDTLVEPDQKLSMPLDVERLFPNKTEKEYAIIHTACGSLLDINVVDTNELRKEFEMLYAESRKTFDHMINPAVCDVIWKKIN